MGFIEKASYSRSVEMLRQATPPSPLSESQLTHLMTGARTADIKRERTIVGEGLFWPYIGFVEVGLVAAVLTDAGGREYTLFDVMAGEFIADLMLVDEGVTAMRFIAGADGARITLLKRDAVRSVCESSPTFDRFLSKTVTKNMRAVLHRFADHVARPATARVCATLLKYTADGDEATRAYPPLSVMTQTQVAREAGTVREIVQRVLDDLERRGIIKRERGRVVQVDRTRLAAASDGLPP